MNRFEELAKKDPVKAAKILAIAERFKRRVGRIKGLESLTLTTQDGRSITLPGADAKRDADARD